MSQRPAHYLAGSGSATTSWDAVVDVSNVCWSPHLPPVGRREPLWPRLNLVLAAWRELHGSRARFTLVADESLVRVLNDEDMAGYRALRYELLTRPVADSLILELAREHSLHVITRDHYVDYRALHPWIENSQERFHRWDTVNGRVLIAPLEIVPRSLQTVSAAVEAKDLKRSRLDSRNPQHRKILGTRWKCGNTLCPEASQWQGQLLVWPSVTSHGAAVCPSCHRPLLGLGPRDSLYEAVLEHRGSHDEILRFPLEVNNPVIVGRGSALKGVSITTQLAPAQVAGVRQVSRQHLLLRVEEASDRNCRMVAIDLGSSNGTAVERWAGTSFQRAKRLLPRRETILGSKDRLVLGDVVNLRLSGRRYVSRPGSSEPSALRVSRWLGGGDGDPTVLH